MTLNLNYNLDHKIDDDEIWYKIFFYLYGNCEEFYFSKKKILKY